jgi:ATP-binding cassette subfamily C protein EexD
VLDEPNSNLDEQGEFALGQAIQLLKQKKVTVIVITHRNNVLAHVDKLLLLNEGLVSVYGPKDEVIAHLQQQQVVATQVNHSPPSPSSPVGSSLS